MNELIKEKLKQNNIRQYELAKLLNVSADTICRRFREELPTDERDRIIYLIEAEAQNRKQKGIANGK